MRTGSSSDRTVTVVSSGIWLVAPELLPRDRVGPVVDDGEHVQNFTAATSLRPSPRSAAGCPRPGRAGAEVAEREREVHGPIEVDRDSSFLVGDTRRHGAVSIPFVVSRKAHVSAPSLPVFAASSYAVEPNPRVTVPKRMADWSRSPRTVPPGRSGAHQTVCSSPAGPIPGRPGTSIRPRTPCGSQRSGRATGWHTVRRAERVRRGDALGGPS